MFYYLYEKIMTPKPTLNERFITALSNDVKINLFQIIFLSKKPSKSIYYIFFPIFLLHFHIYLTSSMRSKYLMFLFTFCHDISGKSIYTATMQNYFVTSSIISLQSLFVHMGYYFSYSFIFIFILFDISFHISWY